jgi:hypothetical protein
MSFVVAALFKIGPCSAVPALRVFRIVTIIQPVGQDAKPAKTENKPGEMAVIFIDI